MNRVTKQTQAGVVVTDTKRDVYRRLTGPLGEDYYRLATALNSWEQGYTGGVTKRDIVVLRNKLDKIAKAINAVQAAIADAYKLVNEGS